MTGDRKMDRRLALKCFVGVLACGLSGCGSTAFTRMTSRLPGVKHPKRPVIKVLSIWEPSNGQGHDGKPSRGAAGQIMFFDTSGPTPVPVHGTVRIYQYDAWNSGNEHLDPEPLHTFVFDDGGWNAHLRSGTLGQTYHVFIPYMQKHPYQTQCAFRVEFTPENAPPVSSEYNAVFLPGREAGASEFITSSRRNTADETLPAARMQPPNVQNGPDEKAALTSESPLLRDTLTIPLPRKKR